MKLKDISIHVSNIYSALQDCYDMLTELKASLPDSLDDTEILNVISNVEDSMLALESFQANEVEDYYDGKSLLDYEE
jgi:hypothetical protein